MRSVMEIASLVFDEETRREEAKKPFDLKNCGEAKELAVRVARYSLNVDNKKGRKPRNVREMIFEIVLQMEQDYHEKLGWKICDTRLKWEDKLVAILRRIVSIIEGEV